MGKTDDGKKNYFSRITPESDVLSRPSHMGVTAPPSAPPQFSGMSGSALRLAVWTELPEQRRREVCMQIRTRCEAFISSLRVEPGRRKYEVDQLLSEVVANLLRATSVRQADPRMNEDRQVVGSTDLPPCLAHPDPDKGSPNQEAQVKWLLDETCNRQALRHRYEDVRRRERGGKWDGSGYPLVAVDDQTLERLSGHYDPSNDHNGSLEAEDLRLAWVGLIQLVNHQFGPDDDVLALVNVLADDPDTQKSFGSQWPVGTIVRALNSRQPGAVWTDDRVDNAKRRLIKFIAKFRQSNGLDAVELQAVLARLAREFYRANPEKAARLRPLYRRRTDPTPHG